jgi:hypothetical protein
MSAFEYKIDKDYQIRDGKEKITMLGEHYCWADLYRWESRYVGFLWTRRLVFRWVKIDSVKYEWFPGSNNKRVAYHRLLRTVERDLETRHLELDNSLPVR